MKSSNVTYIQSVGKDDKLYMSEHAVETVTNKIHFKETNDKIQFLQRT
jgi:hypothetical protein